MSDNIVPYYMFESGNIPGIPGVFGGGQTVWVDLDTRQVVDRATLFPPAIEEVPITKDVPVDKIVENVSHVDTEGQE